MLLELSAQCFPHRCSPIQINPDKFYSRQSLVSSWVYTVAITVCRWAGLTADGWEWNRYSSHLSGQNQYGDVIYLHTRIYQNPCSFVPCCCWVRISFGEVYSLFGGYLVVHMQSCSPPSLFCHLAFLCWSEVIYDNKIHSLYQISHQQQSNSCSARL